MLALSLSMWVNILQQFRPIEPTYQFYTTDDPNVLYTDEDGSYYITGLN